jgi:hypothetical protein
LVTILHLKIILLELYILFGYETGNIGSGSPSTGSGFMK